MRLNVVHLVQAVAKFIGMQIEKADNHKERIITLLTTEKLPASDLPVTLENFLVALENNEMIGVAGLEIYDNYGLLRSLAVKSNFRNRGVADKLLQRIHELGNLKGLTELYLLTETAPGYFEKKGFKKITRTDVPASVQQSSEFRHVCPESAIVMKRSIQSTLNN